MLLSANEVIKIKISRPPAKQIPSCSRHKANKINGLAPAARLVHEARGLLYSKLHVSRTELLNDFNAAYVFCWPAYLFCMDQVGEKRTFRVCSLNSIHSKNAVTY